MSFPRSLRARLLLAFFLVIGATLGTVAVAALLVGPGYFAEAMGHLPGDPMGAGMDAATRAAFNEAMQRALVAATVIAIVSATVVSLAVAARIAGPIGALAAATRRIAGGHYAERVPISEPDEFGELATSFNDMASSLAEAIRFPVAGMTCTACVNRITRAVRRLDGVSKVDVDLRHETATVRREPALVTNEALAAAVKEAGYEADLSAAVIVPMAETRGLLGRLLSR